MCNFFSFLSDGAGKMFYFDAEARKALRKSNPKNYKPDSHTSIANYFGISATAEDKLNKWEYNPFIKELVLDHKGTKSDKTKVSAALARMDWTTVEPNLIVKPILHPWNVKRESQITEQEKQWLKEWASVGASVWDSVRDSVWDSVWASVRDSIWASVRDSVRDSVWDSVRDSVRASVRASVWDSVRASVWDSVRDSVWAYVGTFFAVLKENYKYQSLVNLWEAGLVPSFDGTVWRLHHKKEIVWKWNPKEKS